MKKITPAVIAIGIALMLTSCSSGKTAKSTAVSAVSSEAVTKASGKESAVSTEETIDYEGKYFLTVGETKILPGTDFAPALKALKDKYPYTVKPGGTCAGNNPVNTYKFSGGSFTVDANVINNKEIVDVIYVNDDSIDCNGVYVGQTKEDVKKVFGNPKEESEQMLVYVSNGTALDFNFDETGKLLELRFYVFSNT